MSPDQPLPPVLVVVLGDKVFGLHPRTGEQQWRVALDPVPSGVGLGRVAVHGPHVFVLSSALHCLDSRTGELKWKSPLPGRVESGTMLLSHGLVFVGNSGEAACFEASDGKLLWHEPFKGEGIRKVSFVLGDECAQPDSH